MLLSRSRSCCSVWMNIRHRLCLCLAHPVQFISAPGLFANVGPNVSNHKSRAVAAKYQIVNLARCTVCFGFDAESTVVVSDV